MSVDTYATTRLTVLPARAAGFRRRLVIATASALAVVVTLGGGAYGALHAPFLAG